MIVAAYLALQIALVLLVLVVAHAAGLRLERLVSAGIVGLAVAMAVAEATSWHLVWDVGRTLGLAVLLAYIVAAIAAGRGLG